MVVTLSQCFALGSFGAVEGRWPMAQSASKGSLACDWSAAIAPERVTGRRRNKNQSLRLLCCVAADITVGHCLSLGGVMSNPYRAEDYRDLANHHRRLASNDSSRETRKYHLYMAKNFSTLAAAARSEEPVDND
jgi:hypothetical protein